MPWNRNLVTDSIKHPLRFPCLLGENAFPDVDIQAWQLQCRNTPVVEGKVSANTCSLGKLKTCLLFLHLQDITPTQKKVSARRNVIKHSLTCAAQAREAQSEPRSWSNRAPTLSGDSTGEPPRAYWESDKAQAAWEAGIPSLDGAAVTCTKVLVKCTEKGVLGSVPDQPFESRINRYSTLQTKNMDCVLFSFVHFKLPEFCHLTNLISKNIERVRQNRQLESRCS